MGTCALDMPHLWAARDGDALIGYYGRSPYWDRFWAGQQALSMDEARSEGINAVAALIRLNEQRTDTDVFDVWEADDGQWMVRIDAQAEITERQANVLRQVLDGWERYGVVSVAAAGDPTRLGLMLKEAGARTPEMAEIIADAWRNEDP